MSPHSIADQVKEQTVNPLLSAMTRYFRGSHRDLGRIRTSRRKARRSRLCLEALESRDMPSALSVADVSVREGPANLGAIDLAGAAALNLAHPRNIVFDNIVGSAHYHDLFVTSTVSNVTSGQVLRFDWASQTYQSFVTPTSGGLQSTGGLAFGPDRN